MIVRVYGGPLTGPPPVAVNVAMHVRTASTSTVVVGVVPAHAPPQLVNAYPELGVAVSVAVMALPKPTWHEALPAPHARPGPLTRPPEGAGAIVNW